MFEDEDEVKKPKDTQFSGTISTLYVFAISSSSPLRLLSSLHSELKPIIDFWC